MSYTVESLTLPIDINKISPFVSDFINFPWQIYQPNEWTPPLKASIVQELSEQNLFFQHGEAKLFLIKKDNKVVTRVSASFDNNFADKAQGYFGHFESINDQKAVNLAFSEVKKWLVSKSKYHLDGPLNFSIYNKYRLQTSGYETSPFFTEIRNPSYYINLLSKIGLKTKQQWNSYDIDQENLNKLFLKTKELSDKIQKRYKNTFRIETSNEDNFKENIINSRNLSMDAFKSNYGYTYLSEEEFLQVFDGVMKIVPPNHFIQCFEQDELIGFGYFFPDFSKVFQEINGDHTQLVKLAQSKPENLVLHTFGVNSKYHNKGVSQLILTQMLETTLQLGVKTAITALCIEKLTYFEKFSFQKRSYAVLTMDLQ